MFDTAKKLTLAAGVSLLALSSTAIAQEEVRISDIDVEASYSAAPDSNAAEAFPQIADDIRAAIAERVPTSSDAADPTIRVDIRKLSLDGTTMFPADSEFNEIEGVVAITSPDGDIGSVSFPVHVGATTQVDPLPEGFVLLTPSTDDFYAVMVNGFADVVAENLANVNTAGDGITK
ncbi:hypothetical protein ACFSUD_07395 [Sulfitobacter aestuarii]|uniref:Uncharacterized protein n=1 Tax=Sulfitobacter aestuarii TaxID=2161676 RepID=A0ABW5U1B5_9RHOB